MSGSPEPGLDQATAEVNVAREDGSRVLRVWVDRRAQAAPYGSPSTERMGARATEALRAVLGRADLDLHPVSATRAEPGVAFRWHQMLRDWRLRPGEAVVNMSTDGRIHSVYVDYHPALPPELLTVEPGLSADEATKITLEAAAAYRDARLMAAPERILYQHVFDGNCEADPFARARDREDDRFRTWIRDRARALGLNDYVFAWDVRVATTKRPRRWRVLVDAVTGRIVLVEDLRLFATGKGRIFDPNPMVVRGDPNISWSDTSAVAAAAVEVTLANLGPRRNGKHHLEGTHVVSTDFHDPRAALPANATADFRYAPTSRRFLSVMAYHHIDRFRTYLSDGLGLTAVPVRPVVVDATLTGDETWAGDEELNLGSGVVADGTDALIILHEYGHALQGMLLPESARGNASTGIAEGFGDFLAAVYYDDRHRPGGGTRGRLFPWCRPPAEVRAYSVDWRFGDSHWQTADEYVRGQIWAATMFELYRKLGGDSANAVTKAGGRDLAIRLFAAALRMIFQQNSPPEVMATSIGIADQQLAGWQPANDVHRKVIYDTFNRRGLTSIYPTLPVDVYIFDGRTGGGYGSADGQDAFDDVLWPDSHDGGVAKDLWTVASPYPASAVNPDPAADHVEPVAQRQTHVYARVRNRGTQASSPITARLYVASAPAAVWPDDWTLVASASGPSVAGAGGAPAIVGPLTWTPPAAGTVLALVAVECPDDVALTQTLGPAAKLPVLALVPFDNNLALRRLNIKRP